MGSLTLSVSKLLRQTLLANSDIVDAVGQRIYFDRAPQQAGHPYITMKYITGGFENDAHTQDADMTWRVYAHTDNQQQGMALGNTISTALHRVMPVAVTGDEYVGYTYIEEMDGFVDGYALQNTPFYVTGATYRVRVVPVDDPQSIPNPSTDLITPPQNGELPIGNGEGWTIDTLTAGLGISIENGVGSITISKNNEKPIVTKSGDYTATPQDHTIVFTANATLYLPVASSMTRCILCVKCASGVHVTIDPSGSETIDGNTTHNATSLKAHWIQSDGTAWWILATY